MAAAISTHAGPPGFFRRAFSTPAPGAPPDRRETAITLACAAGLGAWLFAYKLTCYLGLAYTSDLFQFAQLATTWLDGRFLIDNCYGNHLSIHTYFFAPALALLVVPFGVPGLLLALAIALGAGFVASVRILRLFALPFPAALAGGLVISAMPLSLHVYQDVVYGFHLDLLLPAMALWLAYFLLRRSWAGSLVMALVLTSVKEEATLLVAAVCGAIFCEDLIRGAARRADPSGPRWPAINRPAVLAALLSLGILPFLLLILQHNAPVGYSIGSFARLKPVDGMGVEGTGTLLGYFLSNWDQWLVSDKVRQWLVLGVAGTFGTLLLRPHFVVFGVATTLISWLMQDDLMWASRLAPSVSFFAVTATLGLASAYQLAAGGLAPSGWTRGRLIGATAVALVIVGPVIFWQLRLAPRAAEVYVLSPVLQIGREERLRADALFATYRQQRMPGDAVASSPSLFRYMDYRSMYWIDRLDGRPRPVWVLYDFGPGFSGTPTYRDYEMVARDGRFALFHDRGAAARPAAK